MKRPFSCLFLAIILSLLHVQAQSQVVQTDSSSRIVNLPSAGSEQICEIVFEGNKKTKPYILQAELDLAPGQAIDSSIFARRIELNRQRLFNLQLFIWVKARTEPCLEGGTRIIFSMQERWYLWPTPIFDLADRNLSVWLEKMDPNRIDYGLHLVQNNFRGRNEKVKINLQHGFNRKYDISYSLPRFRKAPNWGLFTVIQFNQSHFTDIRSENGRPVTYRNDLNFPRQRWQTSLGVSHQQTVQRQSLLALHWHRQQVTDTVLVLNPEYFFGNRSRSYMQVELAHTRNFRNTFSYPLSGHYLRMRLLQNIPFSDGANYITQVSVHFAWYKPLRNNFYYSIGTELQTKLSSRITYFDNQALGYGSYVRGYELYVADGQHFGLLKQGLTYAIVRNKTISLKWLKNPRFNQVPISVYFNYFADAGYVADRFYGYFNRFISNTLLASTGVGLHFVTYYDRVFTFEYSVNRLLERHYFFRVGIPI